jgi:hypothetical protein
MADTDEKPPVLKCEYCEREYEGTAAECMECGRLLCPACCSPCDDCGLAFCTDHLSCHDCDDDEEDEDLDDDDLDDEDLDDEDFEDDEEEEEEEEEDDEGEET